MNRITDAAWADILRHIRLQHSSFGPGELAALEGATLHHGVMTVHVNDDSVSDILRQNWSIAFAEAAQLITGHLVTVDFAATRPPPHMPSAPPASRDFARSLGLNPDYLFDHFVTGPENQLAHAACSAAAESPGNTYNPLFIHGPSGLGKTHLLQAICHRVAADRPHLRVLYLTCEMFVNDFIEAVQKGLANDFRNRYREADILVLDDIQFLSVAERTQDEFFHTFNTLYQSQRQIVLSADCAPSEIPDLADRLVSRFKWGLVVRIDPLSVETRIAILRSKARLKGIQVPDDVLAYIGTHIKGTARELEGALVQVRATASVMQQPMTVDRAREVLGRREVSTATVAGVAIPEIIAAVARYYSLKPNEICGKRRHQTVALARQMCMYLARQLTHLSLEEIGTHFNGRDHSTVLYAFRTIEQRKDESPEVAAAVTELLRQLSEGQTTSHPGAQERL